MMFKATAKTDADKINALVGSKSPYLDEQEAGGTAENKAGGPVKSIPSLQARGGSWSKPVGARFRRKRMGTIGHRGGGGRMTPKGAQFFWLSGKSLRTPTMFFRNATGLHKVFLSLKSRLQVKPTHWHSNAMAKAGRPELMSAAYGVELNKALTRLGAK